MRSQNAANAISGVQILKIFWGGMPPDTPKKLVPSALAPQNFAKFPPLAAMHYTLLYYFYFV
jgi:hypothetical protein